MNYLPPGLDAIVASESMPELQASLASLSSRLGLDSWAALAIEDRGARSETVHVLSQLPMEYQRFMNEAAAERDPVMQRCKRSSAPFLWGQDDYVHSGLGALWEEMADVGMGEGVISTLHMPRGRHFVLGFEGEGLIKARSDRHFETLAMVQLALVHTEAAFERIVWGASPQADSGLAGLTPRELECLRWTSEGKTAWEIGVILSIAERTANKHLDTATTKLGAANKLQAVARALRCGLIS